MRITEVSLNEHQEFPGSDCASFPLGTIAISGPNGAGKSTILEAIGFALFDCLPYRNQREFMRHNATEADVRVSFLSRLDECEYQAVRTLRRTTGSAESVTSTYFVHSFASNSRVAQQKQDVLDFLRSHIGLDDYDDLARVFDNVLGVPQGRLTADFLLTPGQRKDTFDPLLRVDAYRHVYDKLRDVLDVMQGNISEQERRVSALEPEAARLPGQVTALAQYEKQHVESAAQAQLLTATQARLQRGPATFGGSTPDVGAATRSRPATRATAAEPAEAPRGRASTSRNCQESRRPNAERGRRLHCLSQSTRKRWRPSKKSAKLPNPYARANTTLNGS